MSTFPTTFGFKKPLDISNLMSPPEPDQLDSFSVNDERSRSCSPAVVSISQIPPTKSTAIPGNGPLSPPISPRDKKSGCLSPSDNVPPAASASQTTTCDPILYPATSEAPSAALSRPLFASTTSPQTAMSSDASAVVNEHVAARSSALFCHTAPPRGEDYELALYMRAQMMNAIVKNPRSWLKKEREQLVADRMAAADRKKRLHHILPAAKSMPPTQRASTPRLMRLQFSAQQAQQAQQAQLSSLSQQHQHQQYQQYSPGQQAQLASEPHHFTPLPQRSSAVLHTVSDASNRVTKRSRAAPTRIAPQVHNTARQAGGSSGSGGSGGSGNSIRVSGASPEPRVRTTAPNREDKDFASLPDYCPPLSTLPERTNNLKVDWKGNALDLSRDTHLHLLHRDEVGLAASLRLDCATYLTSKRRIFIRRLECARIGKEFRKTDAQQACKIDVNKASKLWTAYEKVGWLRIDHMKRFL